MKSKSKLIRENILFDEIKDDDLKYLASLFEIKIFPKGKSANVRKGV